MNYSKPQILIDLDEYNHLKAIEEKSKLAIGDITENELSDAVSGFIYKVYVGGVIPREFNSGNVLIEISEDSSRQNGRKITFTKR